ncbi:homolog of asparagine-linked glycosylation 12 isoform X6 [Carex rostrata]
MAPEAKPRAVNWRLTKFLRNYEIQPQFSGWDLLLGSIGAFYVIVVPYTKVEESFNVQAMHDILYHRNNIAKYDHLEFPGVVPRTFIATSGAFVVSALASPLVSLMQFLHAPKIYSLLTVNFAYACWLKGNATATLRCLIIATVVFRCDTVLLLAPIGLELLLNKCISLWEAIKCGLITTLLSVGCTVFLDSILWQRTLWPEFEVFWFNSVQNRSSEWGTHPFHWYFTSALPRALFIAYPLSIIGVLLDRRIRQYIVPVFLFVLLYSKLPHKELRFIIASVPIFNLSASLAASRVHNNRKKHIWMLFYVIMLGSFLVSLGFSALTMIASYNNYPGGYALKKLHQADNSTKEKLVHIDAFTAINGVSRFCENEYPWRYSKEEGIVKEEYQSRNFTYLLNEHSVIDGYQCLFAVSGFSGFRLKLKFPLVFLFKEPKVYVHGNIKYRDILSSKWPGCN